MGGNLTKIRKSIPLLINETEKPVRTISYKDLDFTDIVISNKEDVTVIWFDENINKRDDVLETKTLLQATNHYVLFVLIKKLVFVQYN